MGELIQTPAGSYYRLGKGDSLIDQDAALRLVAACGEHGVSKLLLSRENLPDEFFDLSTGLAGEILIKFSTYRVRAAFIVDRERIPSQHFQALIAESNRGNEIHFCADQPEAVSWLLSAEPE
jgi:hypothetical protein